MKYSAALSGHVPGTASDLLRHRVTTGRKTTDAMVEWMDSFAKVNETYAQEIERMLRRTTISDTDLGTLATAWGACASMAVEIARLSSMLGSRIRVEVKQPLDDFLETGWTPAESALKHVVTSTGLDEDKIDAIQRADLARLVTIKETLIKFQTIVADEGQGVSKASEKGLRELLAFEPHDDIESYVAQIVAGAAVAEPEHSHRHDSRSASSATHHTSRRHASLQSLRSSHTANEDSGKHTGIRAKVGSIFGRRKQKNQVASTAPELRRADSATSSFREHSPTRSRTSSFQPASSAGASQPAQPQYHSDPFPDGSRKAPPPAAYTSVSEPATTNGRVPPPAPPPQRTHQSASHLPSNHPTLLASRQPPAAAAAPSQPGQFDPLGQPISIGNSEPTLDSPFRQPQTASQEELASLSVNGPPSSTRRRRDIQSALFTNVEPAQRESMVGVKAQTPLNGSPEQEEFFTPAQQFNSTFDAPRAAAPAFQPVMEESPMPTSQPVFASAASSINTAPQLQQAPQASQASQPIASGVPGADVSTTSINSFDQDSMGHAPNFSRGASTRRAAPAGGFGLQRAFTGDVTSSHPPLPQESGLVVTVKENLTTRVVDGQIVEAQITGEINGACTGEVAARTVIRLAGAETAQSVVANQPYMTAAALGDGFYDVDASTFAGQTVTLAKYTGQWLQQVPIVFSPAWRIEENQARLMLSYGLPDSYPHESVVLENLVVAVMVSGGHATAAQSKPIATFSQEKQRVTWRFAKPVELRRGQVQRLLCQLATESRAEEAPGGIEVRFSTATVAPAVQMLAQRASTGEWAPVPANTLLFVNRYSASSA